MGYSTPTNTAPHILYYVNGLAKVNDKYCCHKIRGGQPFIKVPPDLLHRPSQALIGRSTGREAWAGMPARAPACQGGRG